MANNSTTNKIIQWRLNDKKTITDSIFYIYKSWGSVSVCVYVHECVRVWVVRENFSFYLFFNLWRDWISRGSVKSKTLRFSSTIIQHEFVQET